MSTPPLSTEPEPAHFAEQLGAWVLARHADVEAALREPRLVAVGTSAAGDGAHHVVRAALAARGRSEWLELLRPSMERGATSLVAALPPDVAVDLVAAVAAPWSRAVAMSVAGAPAGAAEECAQLARTIFHAAASSTDGTQDVPSRHAAVRLATLLARPAARAGAPGDVQAFVALSQSLPALLAGAWLALVRQPEAQQALRGGKWPMARAVEELLRVASPARAVYRVARADVALGSVAIRAGDRLILLLGEANRDPRRFDRPHDLDMGRKGGGHMSLGAGEHGCAGASLVRLALAIATTSLLRATTAIEFTAGGEAAVEWLDGVAIRAPATLPVVVRR